MKPNYESYIWHEMGFFTSWLTSNHTVIICYDAPLVFQEYLLGALLNPTRSIEYANPYFFQTLIIDAIIGLHDVSVQGLQKHIRRVEEVNIEPKMASNRLSRQNIRLVYFLDTRSQTTLCCTRLLGMRFTRSKP